MKRLILASSSPRRRELLSQIGLVVDVIPSSAPEEWTADAEPREVARKLAMDKASDVVSGITSGIVIGADTLVVLQGRILGKPQDPEDAFRMLRELSGKRHEVITAVALVDVASGERNVFDESTRVFFRDIKESEIRAYIASGEPMDKAGAYGIQEKGILFVRRIEGCYTNVVGLPLGPLVSVLSGMGVDLF